MHKKALENKLYLYRISTVLYWQLVYFQLCGLEAQSLAMSVLKVMSTVLAGSGNAKVGSPPGFLLAQSLRGKI